MLRASLRIISFGIVFSLLVSFVACGTGEQVTAEEQLNIADITSDPTRYEGKKVTVSGEYRGWESGHGSPPVTRSDWVLKDETGAIYVTGKVSPKLDPADDRGQEVTVYGTVRVKEDKAYLEAETIK